MISINDLLSKLLGLVRGLVLAPPRFRTVGWAEHGPTWSTGRASERLEYSPSEEIAHSGALRRISERLGRMRRRHRARRRGVVL